MTKLKCFMVGIIENEMKVFYLTVYFVGFYMIVIVECRISFGMSNLILGLE